MNVVLISTYELGRQPFGLASPAAWLRRAGALVTSLDLAVQPLEESPIAAADLIAFYVPMHTATRLAARLVERIRALNTTAHLCFYGLYAPMNESFLRKLGAETILGGEFEEGLVSLVRELSASGRERSAAGQSTSLVSLARQNFFVPDRRGLPVLDNYARLQVAPGVQRTVGYTEASRGCKHLCRHCPVVPVYQGNFRIVQRDVVLEDIRRQVAAGARHITFGDPDFFNGPTHAITLVRALHEELPDLSYDVTIKIEHLLKHASLLPTLRDTGCLFVTCAVESVDDAIVEIFDKRHTRQDFVRAVALFREVGLSMNPTFVTFTPWTTIEGYIDLLTLLLELDLVDNVAPVQYAIRLLIPAGSRLLELPAVCELLEEFDESALVYPWNHPDPRVDQLFADVMRTIREGQARDETRREIFRRVWRTAHAASESAVAEQLALCRLDQAPPRAEVPFLTEPWYC